MSLMLLPATNVRLADFVLAFNLAYQDYIVPIHFDLDQMRQLIKREAVDLSASRVVLVDDEIVGMAMLAKREKRGWIGGVGVVPEQRGKGIGRILMQEIIAIAQDDGLESIQLEVIEGNVPAYSLYLNLGFRTLRKLLIVEQDEVPPLVEGIIVRSTSAAYALRFHDQFHARPTPWQRHLSALRTLAIHMDGWTATREGQVLAYAVAWPSESQLRFMDMAFLPGETEAMKAVVAAAQQEQPIARFVNLAEDDPVWSVLSELGYRHSMSQLQMELSLKGWAQESNHEFHLPQL